jgi:hypothetical protein
MHRCAVCWERFKTHAGWFEHAEQEHGSTLGEFGYQKCCRNCLGEQHAARLPNEGRPRVPRAKPVAVPFVARDGAVYTPVPLPFADER